MGKILVKKKCNILYRMLHFFVYTLYFGLFLEILTPKIIFFKNFFIPFSKPENRLEIKLLIQIVAIILIDP